MANFVGFTWSYVGFIKDTKGHGMKVPSSEPLTKPEAYPKLYGLSREPLNPESKT